MKKRRPAISFVLIGLSILLAAEPGPSGAQSGVKNGKIAFISNMDGDFEVYVIDPDGTNLQQLTFNDGDETDPQWSPDGTRILYSSLRPGGTNEIWIMDADGSNQTSLTPLFSWAFRAQWSPDGNKIAFVAAHGGGSDIYIMNEDGTNPQNLTNAISATEVNTLPFWSPSGDFVYFLSDRNYEVCSALDICPLDIYRMTPTGDDLVKLFLIASATNMISISPAGDLMLYDWQGPSMFISVKNLDGSSRRELLADFDIDSRYPAWSPDGQQIVYVKGVDTLAVMNADGENQEDVFVADEFGIVRFPSWQPVVTPLRNPE